VYPTLALRLCPGVTPHLRPDATSTDLVVSLVEG